MTSLRLPVNAGACLLALALSAPTFANETSMTTRTPMATKLSAALGDTLDGGMIISDLPGHGSFQADAPVNLGRGATYRSQVALLASHIHLATSAH